MANAGLTAVLATAGAVCAIAVAGRFAMAYLNEEARQWRQDELSGAAAARRTAAEKETASKVRNDPIFTT